jgi:hypothetical protein
MSVCVAGNKQTNIRRRICRILWNSKQREIQDWMSSYNSKCKTLSLYDYAMEFRLRTRYLVINTFLTCRIWGSHSVISQKMVLFTFLTWLECLQCSTVSMSRNTCFISCLLFGCLWTILAFEIYKKINAKKLHTHSYIRLTLGTLSWKRNTLLNGRTLLVAYYWTTLKSVWSIKPLSRKLIFRIKHGFPEDTSCVVLLGDMESINYYNLIKLSRAIFENINTMCFGAIWVFRFTENRPWMGRPENCEYD